MTGLSASYQQASCRLKRQQQQKERNRLIWKISLCVLLVSILLWSWLKLLDPHVMPVHFVKIQGNYVHLDKDMLRKTIMPFVSNKSFFAVNVDELRDGLKQLAWVQSVSIQRIWPDALEINVIEQKPIARWGAGSLLNNNGELFSPGKVELAENLPQLDGPSGEQGLVLQSFREMNAALAPLELKISSLTLEARHAWHLQLNNGMTLILGRDDALQRLQRFVKAYHEIFSGKSRTADYVDLRYSHGMAIHWT